MTSFKDFADSIGRQRFQLVRGPSKFDLMLALFDRDGFNTRTVELTDITGIVFTVRLFSVGVDGGDDSWAIYGLVTKIGPDVLSKDPRGSNFQGLFRTDSRDGYIFPVEGLPRVPR